jgi:hypothetical protein
MLAAGRMNAAELLRSANGIIRTLDRCRNLTRSWRGSAIGRRSSYAAIAVLSYRQALAAHKLVTDFDGTPLWYMRISTMDASPRSMSPIRAHLSFYFSIRALKAQIRPIWTTRAARWRFPFAPHGRAPTRWRTDRFTAEEKSERSDAGRGERQHLLWCALSRLKAIRPSRKVLARALEMGGLSAQ